MQMKNIIFIMCFTAFVALRVEHVDHIGPPPDPDISLDVSQADVVPITADLSQALNVHQYRIHAPRVDTEYVQDADYHPAAKPISKKVTYLITVDKHEEYGKIGLSPPAWHGLKAMQVHQDKEIDPGSWELGSGIDR